MNSYFKLSEGDLEYMVKTFFTPENDWTIISALETQYIMSDEEMNKYNKQRLEIKYKVRSIKFPKQSYTFYIWIHNNGDYSVEQDVGGSSYAINTFAYTDFMRSKGFPFDVSRTIIIDKMLKDISS